MGSRPRKLKASGAPARLFQSRARAFPCASCLNESMPKREGNAAMSTTTWSSGAAYMHGRYMPLDEATIPVTDFGYRRSDVTYDVVGVWGGAFFRLDDHIKRFRRSIQALRLDPPETDGDIRRVLTECVRRTGLKEAYVAMDCLRGRPKPGL